MQLLVKDRDFLLHAYPHLGLYVIYVKVRVGKRAHRVAVYVTDREEAIIELASKIGPEALCVLERLEKEGLAELVWVHRG